MKFRWKKAWVLCLLGAAAGLVAGAQTFTTLAKFDGHNGGMPYGPPVQDLNGDFYGTTYSGGASQYYGTIYRMTPQGALETLYSFCCFDDPFTGLTVDVNGTLYGTSSAGAGSIFKIAPGGTFSTLYSFSGGTDGSGPVGGLILANSEFYGTAAGGGTDTGCHPSVYGSGCGTIFKVTANGTLTTLYNFSGADGDYSVAPLFQGYDGNFYGTTAAGGVLTECAINGSAGAGCGTIFKITPSGKLTTLHTFNPGYGDGDYPVAMLQTANRTLYGVTAGGGYPQCGMHVEGPGCGTVFSMAPDGTFTTLYYFCSQPGCTDGAIPDGGPPYARAGFVQGSDGNFYGTTAFGGTNNDGTIFQITPSGTLTVLHSFDGADDDNPYGGLTQGTDGSFYGTTADGGANHGTVFNLSIGLSAFVETVPAAGRVGVRVQILGNNLFDATAVTFNGTPTAFTINSSGSAISAVVPSGATTGAVQVATPSGLLSSNVPFRVP